MRRTTIYYNGRRFDVAAGRYGVHRVSVWQGSVITADSGALHVFYRPAEVTSP